MNCELPTLRGEHVGAAPALQAAMRTTSPGWSATPRSGRWWGSRPDDFEHHRDGFISDAAGNEAFAIEVDGALAGWLGVYEEEEADYRHAGLDIFIDPGVHGAGHGSRALRLAARWLLDERGHHRLIIDPAAANERAIAVYAGLGLRPVGVMRAYSAATTARGTTACSWTCSPNELR